MQSESEHRVCTRDRCLLVVLGLALWPVNFAVEVAVTLVSQRCCGSHRRRNDFQFGGAVSIVVHENFSHTHKTSCTDDWTRQSGSESVLSWWFR